MFTKTMDTINSTQAKDQRLIRLIKYAGYIIGAAFAYSGNWYLLIITILTHAIYISAEYLKKRYPNNINTIMEKTKKPINVIMVLILICLVASSVYVAYLDN